MTLPEFCPSCGMPGSNITELPDGTWYCNIERALVVQKDADDSPALDVPEVQIHHDEEDAERLFVAGPPDEEAFIAAGAAHQPPEDAPADSGEVAVHAAPESAPIEVVPTPDDNGADDDEGGPNIAALKLIIGLCLQAGVMSLDAKNMPLEPPTGWAPPPADQVPEFAAGCAMAVALMIRTFGIEHTDVIALAKQFIDTDTTEE